MTYSVYIADDHPIVRQGLIKLIESDDRFQIVGEGDDGAHALSTIRELTPDIAVLDISMPKLSGIDVAEKILSDGGKTRFVILTMYKDEEYFNDALDRGVMGYILKESAVADLLRCFDSIVAGRFFVSPFISDYLVRRTQEQVALRQKAPAISELTPMERRVLKYVADNLTSKEIAEEIGVSYRTIQNHRNHISQKLGLKGHNALLKFALENKGLL